MRIGPGASATSTRRPFCVTSSRLRRPADGCADRLHVGAEVAIAGEDPGSFGGVLDTTTVNLVLEI
jgi:hypothetical protein